MDWVANIADTRNRSSYVFGIVAISLILTLILNDYLLVRGTASNTRRGISTLSYLIGQTIPLLSGSAGLLSFLDVIVPLTGRMGVDAPSDIITASLGEPLPPSERK